jgi:hypothetical protein
VGATVRRFDLLAIALCQPTVMLLMRRYREQAHSHRGICDVLQIFRAIQ